MVHLKVIQKITPMDVSVSGTIGQRTYLKKFKGGFSPLNLTPRIRLWICIFFYIHSPYFMCHCTINYQRSKLGYRRKTNSTLWHSGS